MNAQNIADRESVCIFGNKELRSVGKLTRIDKAGNVGMREMGKRHPLFGKDAVHDLVGAVLEKDSNENHLIDTQFVIGQIAEARAVTSEELRYSITALNHTANEALWFISVEFIKYSGGAYAIVKLDMSGRYIIRINLSPKIFHLGFGCFGSRCGHRKIGDIFYFRLHIADLKIRLACLNFSGAVAKKIELRLSGKHFRSVA